MSDFRKIRQAGRRRNVDPFGQAIPTGNNALAKSIMNARASGNLNLPNRELTEFPTSIFEPLTEKQMEEQKWWEAAELTSIVLNNNLITTIPDSITAAAHCLAVLCMPHNKLEELPPALFACTELKKLDVSNNQLRGLSEGVGQLCHLVELNVSNNNLTALPGALGHVHTLEALNASHNQLSSVPSFTSTSLVRLVLSYNNLRELPAQTCDLRKLAHLEVHHNCLQSPLPSFARMPSLAFVDISFNKLHSLPLLPTAPCALNTLIVSNNSIQDCSSVCSCVSLVTIDLKANRLVQLPTEIAALQQLAIIDVSNNNLADVPAQLGCMPALNKVVLDGNPLRKVPRSKLSAGVHALKKYLKSRLPAEELKHLEGEEEDMAVQFAIRDASATRAVSLRKYGLSHLPPELLQFHGLRSLDVSENKMPDLDESLHQHSSSLQVLTAEQVGADRMPPVVLSLANLHTLSMKKNSLRGVPQAFGQLANLHTLDLANNKLEEFPQVLLTMGGLQHLHLSYNRMTCLPSLASLPKLQTIDCGNNQLCKLGPGLRHLPCLSFLNLENNALQAIPDEFGVLGENVKSLLLAGNPQRRIKHTIISQGAAHIIAYIRKMLPEDSPLLQEDTESLFSTYSTPSAEEDPLAPMRDDVARLQGELEDLSLSAAKKFAVKKQLAMAKAKLIREERKLKALR
mmetsp:Transcript_826/g.1605  ORF Transcript_826/g.1605 Transcript_826/m.1605 type:complete len:684 (-) Transcript_826:47-2098(-)